MTRHALLVLGMHRSGTSALTRVLGLMGAALPHDPMPPTADNPQGYWESQRIARLNNRLLESAGTDWSNDAAIPPEWFADPCRAGDREEAIALLANEFAAAPSIVLKDPRICRLIPFWKTVLDAAGFDVVPPMLAYACAKQSLWTATRFLARELAPEIRVNAVCPGTVNEGGEPKVPTWASLLPRNAIQRIGLPEEVAGAVVFLASEASSYTTGQVVFCDGGRVNT